MKWLWLLLFPLAALGQASNPQYVYTPTNPNGLACTYLSVAYQYLGNIYTCSNGSTYTQSSAAGGPFLPLAGGATTGATGGAPLSGGINATQLLVNGKSVVTSATTFDATQYSGATIAEQVNACLTAAIAVGGMCDASGFTNSGLSPNTGVITAALLDETITVGNTNGDPVGLILPAWFWWDFTMTGGTSCGVQQYSATSIYTKNLGSSLPSLAVISSSTSSNLASLFCISASTGQGAGNYVYDGGFQINNGQFTGHGAVTANNAAVLINAGLNDVTTFDHFVVADKLDTYAVEAEGGLCCSITFRTVQINGLNASIPLYFNNTTGNSLSAVNIVDSSIVHNPTGSALILVSDTASHTSSININNLYSEVYSVSGGLLQIQGAGTVNVNNWTLKAYTASMSSPSISTTTAANTSLTIRGLYNVNGSGSWTGTQNPISNANASSVLSMPRVDSTGSLQEYLYSPNAAQDSVISSLWNMGYLNGMEVQGWATGNTAVGTIALPLSETGTNNTAVGNSALGDNTSGSSNTAVGVSALGLNTSAADNTGFGYHALEQITTGANNTAVGYQAGQNGSTMQTNLDSVFLGYDAYCSANALTNDLVLGYSTTCTASNQVVLGNSSITSLLFEGLTTNTASGELALPLSMGYIYCTQANCATSATSLATTQSASVALYRVDIAAVCTTAVSVATVNATITYTDTNSNTQTVALTTPATCTTLTTSAAMSGGSVVFAAKPSTAINYNATTSGSPTGYTLRVALYQESLN